MEEPVKIGLGRLYESLNSSHVSSSDRENIPKLVNGFLNGVNISCPLPNTLKQRNAHFYLTSALATIWVNTEIPGLKKRVLENVDGLTNPCKYETLMQQVVAAYNKTNPRTRIVGLPQGVYKVVQQVYSKFLETWPNWVWKNGYGHEHGQWVEGGFLHDCLEVLTEKKFISEETSFSFQWKKYQDENGQTPELALYEIRMLIRSCLEEMVQKKLISLL